MKEYINFRSSGAAYDACNSRDEMYTGRIFTVESEKIVGISWAWPIAITKEYGHIHSVSSDPRTWTVAPKGGLEEPEIAASVKEAIELAQSKGWPVAEVYDLTM
jgi:hypothetical protein